MAKAIPPFGGALVRYRVKDTATGKTVSVYLDCYDLLGYFGSPYWEVYPCGEDVGRCHMSNVDSLLEMILVGLQQEGDK